MRRESRTMIDLRFPKTLFSSCFVIYGVLTLFNRHQRGSDFLHMKLLKPREDCRKSLSGCIPTVQCVSLHSCTHAPNNKPTIKCHLRGCYWTICTLTTLFTSRAFVLQQELINSLFLFDIKINIISPSLCILKRFDQSQSLKQMTFLLKSDKSHSETSLNWLSPNIKSSNYLE